MSTATTHPTDAQLDGRACIRCGRDLADVAGVPVGIMQGGQVFACADHLPKVGDSVHYAARVMSGISFDADGASRSHSVERDGKVQAVHSDHVLVGDDDAPEWVEVPLRDVLPTIAPPTGARAVSEWTTDVDGSQSRRVVWFAGAVAHVEVSVDAWQCPDGTLTSRGVDVYAETADPLPAVDARRLADLLTRAAALLDTLP